MPPRKRQPTLRAEPPRGQSEPSPASPSTVRGEPLDSLAAADHWLREPERLGGTFLGGRYRIQSLLGRGPLGMCLAASAGGDERPLVIKLVPRPPELAPDRFMWIVREALALAQFDHEAVASIFDWGELDEDGSVYMVRSRVAGPSLRERLRRAPFDLEQALAVACQVAAVVSAAHARDIQHRRLKPENVIFAGPSGDEVRVVDFGCSALPVGCELLVNAAAVRAGLMPLGPKALAYAPPLARSAGPAEADVHALGALLHEMLTGEPPYPPESLTDPLRHARPLPSSIPAAVSDWVRTLLSSEPPSARDAQRRLDALAIDPLGGVGRAPLSSRPSRPGPPPTVAGGPAPQAARRASSAPPPMSPALAARLSHSSLPPQPAAPAPMPTLRAPQVSGWALDAPVIVAPPPGPSLPGSPVASPPSNTVSLDSGAAATPASSDDDMDALRPSLMSRLGRLFRRSSKPDPFE